MKTAAGVMSRRCETSRSKWPVKTGSTCQGTGLAKAWRMNGSWSVAGASSGRLAEGTTGWAGGSKPTTCRGQTTRGTGSMTPTKKEPALGCLGKTTPLKTSGGSLFIGANQLLLDTGGLTRTAAQIIQFSTADITTALHFDAGDLRGVELERTFNGFARRDLAHDERRVQAAAAARNDNTFVGLHTLAGAFNHVHVYNHGVAGAELGAGLAAGQALDFFLLEDFNKVHDLTPKNIM